MIAAAPRTLIARALVLLAAVPALLAAQSAPGNAIRQAQKAAATANDRTRELNAAQRAAAATPEGAPRAAQKGRDLSPLPAPRKADSSLTLYREVYQYDAGGRRDPFASLIATGVLRPLLQDLRLVGVAYDPTGRNSVAIMRDMSTKEKEQYRVKVGQTVGRMRVAQIQQKAVIFTIEEYGFSRRETLTMGDTSKVRTP